jgi:monoterpene epsilon-lactone hydrolase
VRGLPPLLIHVSDSEVLFDDSRRFAERARAAGVEVQLTIFPQQVHDFHASVPLTPESREAVRQVGTFFGQRLG